MRDDHPTRNARPGLPDRLRNVRLRSGVCLLIVAFLLTQILLMRMYSDTGSAYGGDLPTVRWWAYVAETMHTNGYFDTWTPYPPVFPSMMYVVWGALRGSTQDRIHTLRILWQVGNAALVLLTGGLVFLMARKRFGRDAAILAGIGYVLIGCSWASKVLIGVWCDQFDQLPVFLMMLSLYLLSVGRPYLSAVACGVGAWTKVFPGIVFLVAAARLRRAQVIRYAGILAIVSAVVAGPFLVANGRVFLSMFRAMGGRGAWESVYAFPARPIDAVPPMPPSEKDPGCPPNVRSAGQTIEGIFTKPYAHAATETRSKLLSLLPLVTLVGWGAVVTLARGRMFDTITVVRAGAICLFVLLVFSKGVSSYYVVWFIPFVCLLYPGVTGFAIAALLVLLANAGLLGLMMSLRPSGQAAGSALFWGSIFVRHAFFVGVTAHQAYLLKRESDCNSPQ